MTTDTSDHTAARRLPFRRGLKHIAYWSAVTLSWLVIILFGVFIWLAHDLPDVGDLPAPGAATSVEILGVDGKRLVRYGPVYGDWLGYDEIPEALVLAFLAVEDRRFFSHGGLDPLGIGRAALVNLRAGGIAQGGSTITQQLAKTLFLSSRRSFRRKAQEALLALWLERRLTKEEILTLYLNRIYFGSGAYGIDAAAQVYFGHSARRLTLPEAALLAGLVKAPSRLAPTHNPDGARDRAQEVLGDMVAAGYLTEAASKEARREPAPIRRTGRTVESRYFTDWVRNLSEQLVGPPQGHRVIQTSLDPEMQAIADRTLTQALDDAGETRRVGQGALVAMAPDGAIKAMTGGRSYAESQFNRAVQMRRQPGSAFKPFVYLAGFEAGLAPDTVLEDAPLTIDGWTPENFSDGYRGPMRLDDAFAASVNTVAARVMQRAGASKVADAARRFGMSGPFPPLPSLALGSVGVSPLELTAAYAGIANGGQRVDPYAIIDIRRGGETLYRHVPATPQTVAAPEDMTALARLMVEVIERGTGRAARLDRPAAGKTGTSQNFRDAWFAGFTAQLVTTVWVGNDDDTPMDGVTGGGLPARIWRDFMLASHEDLPVRPLPPVSPAMPTDRSTAMSDPAS